MLSVYTYGPARVVLHVNAATWRLQAPSDGTKNGFDAYPSLPTASHTDMR